MCSSKPPKPDPAIGQAALQQTDIAKQQLDLTKQQLDYDKAQSAWQDPLIQKVAQQQIDSADTNTARADDQWNQYKTMFQPVENQMVSDAQNFDSPERQALMASQAGADVANGYQGALASNQRSMERMGVNPNSGKFAAINNETNLAQAKDTAGAMNTARNNTIMQGMALRQGAAQFGRNMPNTGLAADSLALNGGNAAVGNMATGANINNNNANTVGNLFNGASNSTSAAGQIGLGLYGNQLNAWNSQNAMMGGLGQGLGQLGGMAAMMKFMPPVPMRTGGVIKNFKPYHSSGLHALHSAGRGGYRMGMKHTSYGKAGLSSMRPRRGYADGGIIDGPGTGTSDSVPASIEGVQPIRVSNGEAVLNKAAVNLVGEDFVHRINQGGLAMSKRNPQEDNEMMEGQQ